MKKVLLGGAVVLSALAMFAPAPRKGAGLSRRKNIVMIVPFPPGGPSDTVARIMAEGMTQVYRPERA